MEIIVYGNETIFGILNKNWIGKVILTYRTIALIVILIFFTFCGKEKDTEDITVPITPQKAIAENREAIAEKTNVDSTSIQEKIDDSIAEANTTYDNFGKFRDEVFKHALEQVRSILCSVYRIQKLDSTEFSGESVIEILSKQSFVEISTINGLSHQGPDYGRFTVARHYKIKIPMALNYNNPYEIDFCDRYCSNTSYESERSINILKIWGNLSGYNDDYSKPIPNDKVAKDIEKNVHAEEIIRSLQRLNMCQQKLPIIEREAAKALSFSIVLKKLNGDLGFDRLDPTLAESTVKKYREFLNQAVSVLNDSKQALSATNAVSDEERNEIISILQGVNQ